MTVTQAIVAPFPLDYYEPRDRIEQAEYDLLRDAKGPPEPYTELRSPDNPYPFTYARGWRG